MSIAELRDLIDATLREMNEWQTAEKLRHKNCSDGITKWISQGKICGLSDGVSAVEKLREAAGKHNGISRTMTTERREQIRIRDNHRCAFCGVTNDEIPHSDSPLENMLHIHHIDCDHHNNRCDNLIAICPTCQDRKSVV